MNDSQEAVDANKKKPVWHTPTFSEDAIGKVTAFQYTHPTADGGTVSYASLGATS